MAEPHRPDHPGEPESAATALTRHDSGHADVGTGGPDVSEQAELTRRAERTATTGSRARRIDESLTRLTAAHAGIALPVRAEDAGRDVAVDDPPAGDPAPPATGRARRAVVRLVAVALAALVLVTVTSGWAAKGWLGSAVRDVAAVDPASGSVVDAAAQQGDQNVLVVATGSAPEPAHGAWPRADTLVVAHVPAGGGDVVAMSIPLDLEVDRPPCDGFDPVAATYPGAAVPAAARTRLASAVDMGGPRCVTRVVQELTGLAITRYVGVDLDQVGAAVDAVGGVEVCVTRPVRDAMLGPVAPEAGTTVLDGTRAADFVRAGDVAGDPGSRHGIVERQQQVLAALLDQALDTGLLDVGRLVELRPALGAVFVSDGAGLDEILALALSLRRLDAGGVTFTAVPTTSEATSLGNTGLRDTDAAALFAALRTDSPLPTGSADRQNGDAVPADVQVTVLNAAGRDGLAAQVGDTLRALGFGVEVANAAAPTTETVIRFSPEQSAAAGLLAATVPAATSVPDPGAVGVLELVLGRSFDDVVRAPAEPVAARDAATPDPARPRAPDCP